MTGTTKRAWRLRSELHGADLHEINAIDSAIRVQLPGKREPVWIPRSALTEVIPPFQVGKSYERNDTTAPPQYSYEVAGRDGERVICWVRKHGRIISSAIVNDGERDKWVEV